MLARSPVRLVLGAAETRLRMHLRRLLMEAAGVQVVTHVRKPEELVALVERGDIDVLLLDAAENAAAALALLEAANRLRLRTIMLTGDHPPNALSQGLRTATLHRPAGLEAEPSNSPFARDLRALLLGGSAAATVAPSGAAPEELPARPRPSAPVTLAPRMGGLPPALIAIGSSTGGPQALPEVLSRIANRVRQPIVLTQHMPAAFTPVLANFLARQTTIPTVQAEEGMPLLPGRIHLAPGGRHLLLQRDANQVVCHLDDGPPVNFCKPAVDPMLQSVVEVYGGRALAVILTGMGRDGLLGCQALAQAGGIVLAQDEQTSVVWGMPGAVAQAGICQAVLPLDRIGEKIVACAGAIG